MADQTVFPDNALRRSLMKRVFIVDCIFSRTASQAFRARIRRRVAGAWSITRLLVEQHAAFCLQDRLVTNLSSRLRICVNRNGISVEANKVTHSVSTSFGRCYQLFDFTAGKVFSVVHIFLSHFEHFLYRRKLLE